AEWVVRNGSRPPVITKAWREAARLLLDRDHRTEEQVIKANDWCQQSEFWRSNIRSMPKLRDPYDTLRLQAARRPAPTARPPPRGPAHRRSTRGRRDRGRSRSQSHADPKGDHPMTPEQVGAVLGAAALRDNRPVGPADVMAWLEDIGDLDPADALAAVSRHYR